MTSSRFTRRGLAASALALGAFGLTGSKLLKEPDDPSLKSRFPEGFRWGTATSAYQIEGATTSTAAARRSGTPSARLPGKIRDGANGDIADDHYHLYKDDVALMKALGAKHLPLLDRLAAPLPRRTRARPTPRASPSTTGWSTSCCANGIEPFATLYHWDLPQALQDQRRLAVARHGAGLRRLCRLRRAQAQRSGRPLLHAQRDPDLRRARLRQRRVRARPEAPAGRAQPGAPSCGARPRPRASRRSAPTAAPAPRSGRPRTSRVALPASRRRSNIRAAEHRDPRAERGLSHGDARGPLHRRLPRQAAGADAPKFTPRISRSSRSPVDFVGINVYAPGVYVRASDAAPGYAAIPLPGLVSAHGIGLADLRPRGALLGAAPCSRSCGT